MSVAAILFFLIMVGILFSIGASLIVIAAAIGIIVGGMTLLQLLLGAVLKRVTGKRPKWLFGPASYVLEGILVCVFFWFWFSNPVTPIHIPADDCVSFGFSNVGYGADKEVVTDQEQVDAVIDLLENCTLKQRINVRFLNEGMVDGTNGTFLTFYDTEGAVIRKMRITSDYVGIAKKDRGTTTVYTYYRRCEETDLSGVYDILNGNG